MVQLCLKFRNEAGDEQQVNIDRDRFVIGRHSDCDLCIRDSRLSRQHCVIEKRSGSHFLTDLGSANGTILNGEDILVETEIRDGDTLDLGGVVIELVSAVVRNEDVLKEELPDDASAEQEDGSQSPPATAAQPQSKAKKKGIPAAVLLMIPMFAIVILLFAGVIIYLAASRSGKVQPKLVTIEDRDPDIEDTDDKPTDSNLPKRPGTQQTGQATTGPDPTDPTPGPATPPPTISPTAAVEEAGARFLRRIAQNDPRAFLTSEQAKRVDSRVSQFKNSAALADNINSARKNAKQITELAAANDIKPQLLAVAAISRLGNSRGDVVSTARTMSEVFGKLHPQIGSERSDDALLLIAAYDQGAAGETTKLRNMLQDLAGKREVSSRELRSIWFLEKEGMITKAEFDKALTFLAIGVITQDPKAFGVNAEPLTL